MAKRTDGETELTTDDKFELLLQALVQKQGNGISKEDLQAILADNSTAVQKALKPENESHPGISAFSYPEGDREKPRTGILKHEFFYLGIPVHKQVETHTWRELELASQVQPGNYTILREDGSPMPVEVKADRNASGVITKVEVKFDVPRGEKQYISPMLVVLYQLVHEGAPRARFVAAKQEYLNFLLALA